MLPGQAAALGSAATGLDQYRAGVTDAMTALCLLLGRAPSKRAGAALEEAAPELLPKAVAILHTKWPEAHPLGPRPCPPPPCPPPPCPPPRREPRREGPRPGAGRRADRSPPPPPPPFATVAPTHVPTVHPLC